MPSTNDKLGIWKLYETMRIEDEKKAAENPNTYKYIGHSLTARVTRKFFPELANEQNKSPRFRSARMLVKRVVNDQVYSYISDKKDEQRQDH